MTETYILDAKQIKYGTLVGGIQRSCAGRKWRRLRPAHDRWSPQTNGTLYVAPLILTA